MAGKSKFQISRHLDDRIKANVIDVGEHEPELVDISTAYILGFHSLNTTNYVGLTTNYKLHHAGLVVVGMVFFKSSPSKEELKQSLEIIQKHTSSQDGLGSFESDQNKHLYLIYNVSGESKDVEKRIYDADSCEFSEEKIKLSILDESKIYAHSCLVKLNLYTQFKVDGDKNNNLSELKSNYSKETKKFSLNLLNSNLSINLADGDVDNPSETFYDHLDVPNDVSQAGDYLPQMSKIEKAKLGDKWRNKMKTQRMPLEMKLEHHDINEDGLTDGYYGFPMEMFLYLQVNDSISKSVQIILYNIRQRISLLSSILTSKSLEPKELKACTFKPIAIGHLVPALYAIPDAETPDYEKLTAARRELHQAYMVPLSRPHFRYSQRMLNLELKTADEQSGYLCNVHVGVQDASGIKGGLRNIIQGTYTYHHYMQNHANDNGWGCAYRSLQTIISWFKHQGYIYSPDVAVRGSNNKAKADDKTNSLRLMLHKESRVPTHEEIQTALVDVGDKQPSFIGSQKWIGSQEVCYVLNHLYDLDSKFISVSSGAELVYKARDLGVHFNTQSTPVMIGGGVLAHTIIGIDFNEKNGDTSYLILDPHYTGSEDLATITNKGWCGWKKNTFWDKSAFYNLCLPQTPIEF